MTALSNQKDLRSKEKLTLITNDIALECGTWQLIGVLFTDRLSTYNDDQDGTVMMDVVTDDSETVHNVGQGLSLKCE